jgi:hypothetical protein
MSFGLSYGNIGIWVGPTVACAFNTAAYLLIFKRFDWDMLIVKAAIQRSKDISPNRIDQLPTNTKEDISPSRVR